MERKFLRVGWMLLATMALVFAFQMTLSAADDPGKAVFEAQKCNTCHSIDAAGITKKMPTSKAPDLSAVGSEKNAEWITKFLHKQEELNGKKHIKEFVGKDEDLTALAKWLESMKGKK